MMITFIHALWGDEYVASWPKILRDIQWGWSWRTLPEGYRHIVYAYGDQNCRYLKQFGIEPVQLSSEPVVDFFGIGDREADGRGAHGTFNYGVSMWEHKRHAITTAFDNGCDEIIWLDWDTRCVQKHARKLIAIIERLRHRAAFQGRLRKYKNASAGGGLRQIYHGGCYYIRSRAIVDEMERMRHEARYVTDETLITWAVNNLYFDGRQATAEEHATKGFDSPLFYGTRMNVQASSIKPLWFEGDMDKSQQFAKDKQRVPEYEYRFYRPDSGQQIPHQVVRREVP